MRKEHIMTRAGFVALGVVALVVLPACQADPPSALERAEDPVVLQSSSKKLDPALCAPGQAGFTLDSHPYFPMVVGNQWFYEGEEDGATVQLQVTVLDETRIIDGITTRVIEEREWEDDELLEVSWNYFAKAPDGSICYYGEDVDIFEEDEIVHDGAWCADEPGNAGGIIMPADPKPGMKYPNEIAPGIAEDEAKIVGSGPVETPFGSFSETLRVREFNPLDGDRGYKVFALGVGLVIDGPVELIDFVDGAPDGGDPIPTDQECGV